MNLFCRTDIGTWVKEMHCRTGMRFGGARVVDLEATCLRQGTLWEDHMHVGLLMFRPTEASGGFVLYRCVERALRVGD